MKGWLIYMNCESCVIKHLSQCLVLIVEYKMGYEEHYYYIIGHMAEAERESFQKYPLIANSIRALRNDFLANRDMIPDIMNEILTFEGQIRI